MKCRICDRLISQDDADRAAEIAGPGHETMCEECAESIRQATLRAWLDDFAGADTAPGAMSWEEWERNGWSEERLKAICPVITAEQVVNARSQEEVSRLCDDLWLSAIANAK